MAEEGLATLRARRANAGSRLKQLIAMEDDVSEKQRLVPDEEDDVALLFAEDENDEEFRSSSDDDEGLEDDDEDDEGNAEVEEQSEDEEEATKGSGSRKRATPDDEMLSSSDLSGSDTDESEGEKELEKQEKLKKRRQRRAKTVVPAIKKLKPAPSAPKPKKQLTASESLMRSQRSSSRASAIESKQALVQKLKKDEKRRAAMAPVVRPKYVELTQEERLREAVETERINVKSLNEFMDQELQKKEMQRQLLLLRRKRLRNIIRLVSQESFVTPTEEVEEARYVHDYINGRLKKKPGRKRKEREETRERLPGDIDPDLPYYRREMWEKRLKLEADLRKKAEKYDEQDEKNKNSDEHEDKKDAKNDYKEDAPKDAVTVSSEQKEEPVPDTESSKASEMDPEKAVHAKESKEVEETKSEPVSEKNGSEPMADKPETTDQKNEHPASDIKEEPSAETPNGTETKTPEPEGTTNKSPTPLSKQVKFAESAVMATDKEETPEEGPEIYEGPVQRIARNMIYFLELDEKIDNVKLKAYLFGEQSLLPASRRYRDLETIVRIGQAVNPYAVVKDERDELLEPATELTEEDSRFDELKKLPKLGVTEMIYENDEDEMEEETAEIVLNTEAPSGLYLPNGNKKACLISGAEVRYFDPALGVPYSTVEVYKLLKQMETGTVPWYSIERGYNDFGAAEIYLGSRDGEVRHAKGVPEGFDG